MFTAVLIYGYLQIRVAGNVMLTQIDVNMSSFWKKDVQLVHFQFRVYASLTYDFVDIEYTVVSTFILYFRTEEETNERIKEFQGYLDNFVQEESSGELEFPSSLNSHDRMLVHEVLSLSLSLSLSLLYSFNYHHCNPWNFSSLITV